MIQALTTAFLFLLVVASAGGQEKLIFTAPILVDAGSSQFTPSYVGFDWEAELVIVRFRECNASGVFIPNGRTHTVRVTGFDAMKALFSLEKANFTSVSFKKRLVQWLQANGTPPYLPGGNITGEPVAPASTTTTTLFP